MPHANHVAWAGLASSDLELSTSFYRSLFGWGSYKIPLEGIGAVTMFTLGADDVALVYRQTPQAKDARVVPHWTLFISVEDTDRALSRAAASGATILRGPFPVADAAEVTAISDPTGAIISLWQPLNGQRAAIANRVGSVSWSELITANATAAQAFYRDVFGWPLRSFLNGRTFVATSEGVRVSIREPTRHDRELPEGWLPYFMVQAVDRASPQAEALGATAHRLTPTAAVITDPTGASFGIMESGAVGQDGCLLQLATW